MINRESGLKSELGKDMDLLKSRNLFIQMKAAPYAKILSLLETDTALLQSFNIMDYSLLLAICANFEGQDCRLVQGEAAMYNFGVIDTLQKYNWSKWLEFKYKSLFTSQVNELSCIEPRLYRERFLKAFKAIVLILKD